MTVTCKCGEIVGRVEIRVIQRCRKGHWLSSEIAPAVLSSAAANEATPGQIRAFHAKCTTVDRMHDQKIGTTKARLLASIAKTSASDIDAPTMTRLLDDLETEIVGPAE